MEARHPIDTRLPEMLRSGRPVRAIFNGLPSPAIVEMCAYAGFDAVIIDNEHGSADLETTEHLLRAARAAGIPALVRCLEHDIPRVLDIGACGVQIPMVQSPEHAAKYDAVVCRGFASPEVTATLARPLLKNGGTLIVSEPPVLDPSRWPVDLLNRLGFDPPEYRPGVVCLTANP